MKTRKWTHKQMHDAIHELISQYLTSNSSYSLRDPIYQLKVWAFEQSKKESKARRS